MSNEHSLHKVLYVVIGLTLGSANGLHHFFSMHEYQLIVFSPQNVYCSCGGGSLKRAIALSMQNGRC